MSCFVIVFFSPYWFKATLFIPIDVMDVCMYGWVHNSKTGVKYKALKYVIV